jgi:AraC-like DNA-binding protein
MSRATLEAPAARDWRFPRAAAGVALMVAHGADRGLTDQQVLAGTGLSGGDLDSPGLMVSAAQELRVVRNLQRHLGDVGREVGERYDVGTFGVLGFALVASRTVLDAMNVGLRFIDLSHTFAIPSAELSGDRVRITVDGSRLPDDVRGFLVTRDAVAIRGVLDSLAVGGVPARLRVLADRALIDLDAGVLDRELRAAGERTLALSVALCRDVVARRRRRSGTSLQTQVLITQRLAGGAPMRQVAAACGLSERSLRRHLAAEATSYQVLLDEVRASLASELLATGLRVEDVAVRLGYAESASFIHAHRRWTGASPRGRPALR